MFPTLDCATYWHFYIYFCSIQSHFPCLTERIHFMFCYSRILYSIRTADFFILSEINEATFWLKLTNGNEFIFLVGLNSIANRRKKNQGNCERKIFEIFFYSMSTHHQNHKVGIFPWIFIAILCEAAPKHSAACWIKSI